MGPDWCITCPWRFALTWLTGWWRDRRHDWNDYHPLDQETPR